MKLELIVIGKCMAVALMAAATNYIGSCATTTGHKTAHIHHSAHHSRHTEQQKQDNSPVDVYVFNELKLTTPTPPPKKKEVF